MISVFIFSLIFINQDVLSVDRGSENVQEVDNKPKLHAENPYYLPQQTVFGLPGSSMDVDASKTSPPSLTISPTTTEARKDEATVKLKRDDFSSSGGKSFSSLCTAEISSKYKDESELLLPSKYILQKSVVLSGYIETPSKTSDDYHVSEMSVSISSDTVQDSVGSTL